MPENASLRSYWQSCGFKKKHPGDQYLVCLWWLQPEDCGRIHTKPPNEWGTRFYKPLVAVTVLLGLAQYQQFGLEGVLLRNKQYRQHCTITACLGLLHHQSNKASAVSTETLNLILLFLQHCLSFELISTLILLDAVQSL
jgi:hypothetical protein